MRPAILVSLAIWAVIVILVLLLMQSCARIVVQVGTSNAVDDDLNVRHELGITANSPPVKKPETTPPKENNP